MKSERTNIQGSKQYFTNPTALDMRLNTAGLIFEIQKFLSGVQQSIQKDEEGRLVTVLIETGKPKANGEGVNSLMAYITAIVNPHTVQGNLREDRYNDYVQEVNTSLIYMIFQNKDEWGIKDEDISTIISFIMDLIIPFASRTVDNKERESYLDTLVSKELGTQKEEQQKSGFLGFGGVR